MTGPGSRPLEATRSWLTAVVQRRHASQPQQTAPEPRTSDLPKDVLDLVLSQLNAFDLTKCAGVNKH